MIARFGELGQSARCSTQPQRCCVKPNSQAFAEKRRPWRPMDNLTVRRSKVAFILNFIFVLASAGTRLWITVAKLDRGSL